MTSPLIEQLGALEVINAVGYATRVGGSRPSAAVLDAMRWAQERYFEIDSLLAKASEVIAGKTGAEAGIVTCSASAALTLGAAAVLARFDTGVMNALPDCTGLIRNEFLYPFHNEFDYDHPIRASGARLIAFSAELEGLEESLAAAITERTAGVVFVWRRIADREAIERIARFCRKCDVPLLLDAAMGLPPVQNLREFVEMGADLVALSGGKHLEGPQNSGLLFGNADLVTSAWLQMVDMDVRPETWTLGCLLKSGVLLQPPRHGIGRGFKVGKDVIAGCLVALERYTTHDHTLDRERWHHFCQRLRASIHACKGFEIRYLPYNGTGQYPVVEIVAPGLEQGIRLKSGLRQQRVITAEDEYHPGRLYLYPMCLSENDLEPLASAVNAVIAAL